MIATMMLCLQTGSILEHGSSFTEVTGKDSLSLNVEFIRVNISRTRKMEVHAGGETNNGSSKLDPQIKSTVVRFSGYVNDIFVYLQVYKRLDFRLNAFQYIFSFSQM